jgi:hypothetical protein
VDGEMAKLQKDAKARDAKYEKKLEKTKVRRGLLGAAEIFLLDWLLVFRAIGG